MEKMHRPVAWVAERCLKQEKGMGAFTHAFFVAFPPVILNKRKEKL